MHIRDIEQSLPSGFHDTFLRKITVDYEKKILLFDITVYMESTDNREYLPQKGRLIVKNLSFFSMDPPDTSHMWQDQDSLWISGSGPLDELREKKNSPLSRTMNFPIIFLSTNSMDVSTLLPVMRNFPGTLRSNARMKFANRIISLY